MAEMSAWKKFAVYGLPPLLWMAFIFPMGNPVLGSSRIFEVFADVFKWFAPHASARTLGLVYIVLRKTLHFIEYGFLAFLLYRAFRTGRGPTWSKPKAVQAASVAIAYGFLDEFLQSFVPNRFGSPFDLAVDTAGILAVIAAIAWAGSKRNTGPDGSAPFS
ncbi:MAG: VanZ family protein [Candidatus Aminicenantes bacterium]|nr:VanZ family protein [Candidatus Aminicenantes bacterium]